MPQHGQRRRDDHEDDEHDGGDRRTERARGAERALDELLGVAEQGPVEHRVERAPEHGQEAHVEHLEDRQHAQGGAADRGRDVPDPRREHEQERDAEEQLDRDAHQRGGGELVELAGRARAR